MVTLIITSPSTSTQLYLLCHYIEKLQYTCSSI